jgi:hypothetical protein
VPVNPRCISLVSPVTVIDGRGLVVEDVKDHGESLGMGRIDKLDELGDRTLGAPSVPERQIKKLKNSNSERQIDHGTIDGAIGVAVERERAAWRRKLGRVGRPPGFQLHSWKVMSTWKITLRTLKHWHNRRPMDVNGLLESDVESLCPDNDSLGGGDRASKGTVRSLPRKARSVRCKPSRSNLQIALLILLKSQKSLLRSRIGSDE